MSTRESGIQERISDAIVETYGNLARVRVRHGTAYSTVGDPDLEVCVRGLYFGFEVKNKEGKLTKIQQHRIEEIQKAGGVGAGIRSPQEALGMIRNNLRKMD